MKTVLVIVLLSVAMPVLAQSTPSALSTDPQQIQSLLEAGGCRYELVTSAQTIANLQKQINDLQKKLAALDPPKKK